MRCPEPRRKSHPVSLLIVTGGHGFEESEFFATFEKMPNVEFSHVILSAGKVDTVPQGGIGHYDVVLFYDIQEGVITEEWRSLLGHGRSYVFLHHAIGSFTKSPEFKDIAGGHANFSPEAVPGVPNTTYHHNQQQRFNMTDPSHPVTCGVGNFAMLDEAYDNVDVDPKVHILMTSDFPKMTPAVAWTWAYQAKRVLFLQPGHGISGLPPDHGPSSYQSDQFKKLLFRGIMWAGGEL
jgi:hypothetical protein